MHVAVTDVTDSRTDLAPVRLCGSSGIDFTWGDSQPKCNEVNQLWCILPMWMHVIPIMSFSRLEGCVEPLWKAIKEFLVSNLSIYETFGKYIFHWMKPAGWVQPVRMDPISMVLKFLFSSVFFELPSFWQDCFFFWKLILTYSLTIPPSSCLPFASSSDTSGSSLPCNLWLLFGIQTVHPSLTAVTHDGHHLPSLMSRRPAFCDLAHSSLRDYIQTTRAIYLPTKWIVLRAVICYVEHLLLKSESNENVWVAHKVCSSLCPQQQKQKLRKWSNTNFVSLLSKQNVERKERNRTRTWPSDFNSV